MGKIKIVYGKGSKASSANKNGDDSDSATIKDTDDSGVVNDGGTEVLQQASGNTAADSVVDGAEVLDNASVTELNDQDDATILSSIPPAKQLYLLAKDTCHSVKNKNEDAEVKTQAVEDAEVKAKTLVVKSTDKHFEGKVGVKKRSRNLVKDEDVDVKPKARKAKTSTTLSESVIELKPSTRASTLKEGADAEVVEVVDIEKG